MGEKCADRGAEAPASVLSGVEVVGVYDLGFTVTVCCLCLPGR